MARQTAEEIFRQLDAAYEAATGAASAFELVGHLSKLGRLDRDYRAALKDEVETVPDMTDDELLDALLS